MSDASDRKARLSNLAQAVSDWADQKTQQLNDQVTLDKALLNGRTGADRLSQANVEAGTAQIDKGIWAFLQS